MGENEKFETLKVSKTARIGHLAYLTLMLTRSSSTTANNKLDFCVVRGNGRSWKSERISLFGVNFPESEKMSFEVNSPVESHNQRTRASSIHKERSRQQDEAQGAPNQSKAHRSERIADGQDLGGPKDPTRASSEHK
jgi:hypothetical protein